MKLAVTSLLIALAASTVSAAAPQPQPTPAAAPSAERADLARRFVNLSLPTDRYLELMRAGARSAVYERVEGMEEASVQAEAEKELDKFFAWLEPTLRARLPRLMEAYAQAYAREFSAQELSAMIAFAGSPAGKHYLANREFVEEDPAVQAAQLEMMQATGPVLEQMGKEACAARAAERVAMGDTKAKCPLSDPAPQAG